MGGARAWIQLGTRSEVTQTRQERCLLWEQDANSYAQCDVGYCRAHMLSQRQYQKNFCLKECHVSYPPWQLLRVIPNPWRRSMPRAGHTGGSCCPMGVKYPFWFPRPRERAAAGAPCQCGARAVSCWGELEGNRQSRVFPVMSLIPICKSHLVGGAAVPQPEDRWTNPIIPVQI